MKPFLNILVGVDYTASSRHALTEGQRIADENGAKVTAHHVLQNGDITEFVDFYMIGHKEMLNAAQSSLEAFADEVLGKDHQVICAVSEGIPHHELVSKANENGHDLLILGNDRNFESGKRYGQFAIRCLRFASMPVLLVNGPPLSPLAPVAACIDFSGICAAIFQNVARMDFTSAASVDVIHATRPPWLRPLRFRYQTDVSDDLAQKEQFREILDGRLAIATNEASLLLSDSATPVLLEDADPTYALINHLEESKYRLIVIGRAGKGLKGLVTDLLGGTAESVIRNARTHVLIVSSNQ